MTETPRVVKTPPCLGGAFVKGLGPRRRLDAADMAGAGVARLDLLLVRFRLMLFHVRDRNRVRRCPSRATRISGRPRSAQPGHGEPDSAAVGEQVDAVALEREYPPGSRRYVTLGGMTLPCRGCATDKQLRVSRPAHCHRHERESHWRNGDRTHRNHASVSADLQLRERATYAASH